MFTVKYRFFEQDKSNRFKPAERLDGPFNSVSQTLEDGLCVVRAEHKDDTSMTYGPFFAEEHWPRPVVYVMNERGSTIAKYDL